MATQSVVPRDHFLLDGKIKKFTSNTEHSKRIGIEGNMEHKLHVSFIEFIFNFDRYIEDWHKPRGNHSSSLWLMFPGLACEREIMGTELRYFNYYQQLS